jgi:hypothetical protein
MADVPKLSNGDPTRGSDLAGVFGGRGVDLAYYNVTELKEAIRITAVTVELTQEQVPADKDLEIYADEIYLKGNYVLAGYNITLWTRRVILEDVSIDVSGRDGQFNPAKPPTPPNRGDAGTAGKKTTEDGVKGGDITILAYEIAGQFALRSNGGDGVKGQSGGDGAPGTIGEDDLNEYGPSDDGFDGARDGGTGGQAGRGGPGGDGGDAGTLLVASISPDHALAPDLPFVLMAEFTAKPGAPAEGGPCGNGGPGGPPGHYKHCRRSEVFDDLGEVCVEYEVRARGPGAPGLRQPQARMVRRVTLLISSQTGHTTTAAVSL